MSTRRAAALMVAGLLVASCGDDAASDPPSSPEVDAADFVFEERDITVEGGTTVTWTNTGTTTHTIKGEGFFSKAVEPGETYRFRFATPGSYDYLCTLHPDDMRGTVKVE